MHNSVLAQIGMALRRAVCSAHMDAGMRVSMAALHGCCSWLLEQRCYRLAACWAPFTRSTLSLSRLLLSMQLLWQGDTAACRCRQCAMCALQGS